MDFAHIKQRLILYAKLMRLHRPIGTLLLLWPTLWALWIAAGGWPGWMLFSIFCVGTLLMRSGGCVMNDLADRNFDAHVKRTRDRPLAAGLVSVKEALWLAAAVTLVAFCLVLALNRFAIALGRHDVAAVMLCYAAMLAVLAGTGVKLQFGLYYYLGLGAAGGIMLYHYTLIRERGREGCFKAFLHNNWVGGVIFAGIAADYALR